MICIYLILLLRLGQGEQLDGGGDGEGVGGLDREPALGPGGVCLAGGGEHQVTVFYQVLCHYRLYRHALEAKKSIISKAKVSFTSYCRIRLYNQFQIRSGLQLVHDLLFEVLREKREEKKVINIIDESYFYITLVKNFQSLLKVESTKT